MNNLSDIITITNKISEKKKYLNYFISTNENKK